MKRTLTGVGEGMRDLYEVRGWSGDMFKKSSVSFLSMSNKSVSLFCCKWLSVCVLSAIVV